MLVTAALLVALPAAPQHRSMVAHHLAGVRWLLWTRHNLQLTLCCCIVVLILAALARVWRAGGFVWHTFASLAAAALAGSAVGLGAGLVAHACEGIARVLQCTAHKQQPIIRALQGIGCSGTFL
jgi:hypothetical protein